MRSNNLFSIICLLLLVANRTQGQHDIYNGETKRRIQEFANDFSREQSNQYQQSLRLAKQKGITLNDQIGDKKISLQQINSIGEALYIGVESNRRSGQITRTDQLYLMGNRTHSRVNLPFGTEAASWLPIKNSQEESTSRNHPLPLISMQHM
jgi:hypothetical protein